MAIVQFPPMIGGGWLYTWGSGYHGQLAQGPVTVALTPAVAEDFAELHMVIKYINAGTFFVHV